MAKKGPTKEELLFQEFIADKKVLIADTSAGVRSGVAKVVKDLGAKTSNILLAPYYEIAAAEVQAQAPQVIICDYHLGEHNGLKLIHQQKRKNYQPHESLFVLVTANAAESAIAEAAEEEVDCYILKPFTLALCRDYLLKTVAAKMRPTPYRKAIDEGKVLLAQKDATGAARLFLSAIPLSKKPSLAYYYYGRAMAARQDYAQAEESYNFGLKFNEYHYKCLTGLFDVLVKRQKNPEAYAVAKKLSSVFPVSPQNLDAILRLAAKNQFFDDIEYYYEVFVGMDYRPADLTKVMSAGLVVAGMFYLSKFEEDKAVSAFEKAIITSSRNPAVLQEIITALIKHGKYKRAEDFLKEFPPISQSDSTYLTMEFLVLDGTGTPSEVVEAGRKLILQGIHDPKVYEIMIKRALEAKSKRAAESLAYNAGTRWPEKRQEFLKMIEGL